VTLCENAAGALYIVNKLCRRDTVNKSWMSNLYPDSGDMHPSTYMYPNRIYKLLVRDTCFRATCTLSWCKRGIKLPNNESQSITLFPTATVYLHYYACIRPRTEGGGIIKWAPVSVCLSEINPQSPKKKYISRDRYNLNYSNLQILLPRNIV